MLGADAKLCLFRRHSNHLIPKARDGYKVIHEKALLVDLQNPSEISEGYPLRKGWRADIWGSRPKCNKQGSKSST